MVCEKAYAKVNLGLKVVGKRNDGYHNLQMVMASINLYDELTFEDNHSIEIITNKEISKLEDNLIYKATKLIKDQFNISYNPKIIVNKKIPIGGGLAGGSSDAAATIRGLNKLWNLGLTYDEMYDIALKLGSDVPFCLKGLLALVEGRGEIIKPLLTKLKATLILIFPNYHCYTKDVFSNFEHYQNENNIKDLIESIYQNDIIKLGKLLFNDLEAAVNQMAIKNNNVTIAQIKEELMKSGCIGATMSGSGSTVIGLCESDEIGRQTSNMITSLFPGFKTEIVEIL